MPRKTNIKINNNDYYRVTATVGRNPDGKPIRKQFYGSSKKEAENKRDEYLAGIRQGLSVGYDKATFGVAFAHWLNHVHRQTIKLPTYIKYERFHQGYIAKCGLSGMRLIDIKAANIQGAYNALMETTTDKNIHEINKILKVFFKYCVKADILVKNPLLAVELPKITTQSETNTALHDTVIEKIVRASKENMKYFPFVFIIFTGLRSGELRALNYKDLDFKDGMINIDKTVAYHNVDGEYQVIVSTPKTAASIRRVPILAEIKPLLQAHIKEVKERLPGIPFSGDFLLFPTATGTYREQSAFLDAFKRLCDNLDIEEGRTIHSLRHTFCTILARQGVSLLDASRLMGHANINVTAKIYSHVTDNDKKNAMQKLSSYFN